MEFLAPFLMLAAFCLFPRMNSKRRLILPWVVFALIFLLDSSSAQPGFVSLDCGGGQSYFDEFGLQWSPDPLPHGETVNISVPNETRPQYSNLRYFPADSRKYCYTLDVTPRARYLVRVSFLYGNFNNESVYPKFEVSLGATHWATIVITDPNFIETRELIFWESSRMVSVCLYNATIGQPFISTLELRQFNGSMYYTDFEGQFYLTVSARINFGADSEAPVRYPDDVFDRLWQSDFPKGNYLANVAPGTVKVSTGMPIEASRDEMPPQKVMRTAVVGTNGSLTYRLNLQGFPGSGWAVVYFSEIEDLAENETRTFRLELPSDSDISRNIVNIEENAQGKYRLYEPGLTNLSLPFVLSFAFRATPDSSRGPLVNAMEINKYLRKRGGSVDGPVLANLVSRYSADWALEGGDPCLPVPWSWVRCNSDSPPRLVFINLSKKNMTGNIPTEMTKFTGLRHLWLDGNSLTGPIPDFTGCKDLRTIHLGNNNLTGEFPSWLAELPNLKELYLQNNFLTGTVPRSLLRKDMTLNFSGNLNLHEEVSGRSHTIVIVCSIVAGCALLIITTVVCYWFHSTKNHQNTVQSEGPAPVQQPISSQSGPHRETPQTETCQSGPQTMNSNFFSVHEIEAATNNFKRKIGSGGSGIVYRGTLSDGREIAVKVMNNNSDKGKHEFLNEVNILSTRRHRSLVPFLGYCWDDSRRMLIYEYMPNRTLRENLNAPEIERQRIGWSKRLEIAKDIAEGIEYLHTGCIPAIIHGDLNSSNILLDEHMRAKVAGFRPSKTAVDGDCSSSQQLTRESDIFNFGVILLELMSGPERIWKKHLSHRDRIVKWANDVYFFKKSANIAPFMDPALGVPGDHSSVYDIAYLAARCVQLHSQSEIRPSISEVLRQIEEAIAAASNKA